MVTLKKKTTKNHKTKLLLGALLGTGSPMRFVSSLSAELQIALLGILFVLGQFRLSEGDRGRWKPLVYGLFARKSGRKWGKVTGVERRVGGVAPGVCGGFIDRFQHFN